MTLQQYCEKLQQYPCYATEKGEEHQHTVFMDIIKKVCMRIAEIKSIHRWEALTRFVQHLFNWSHFNEKEKDRNYFSERIGGYGTHHIGGIGYFAELSGVGRSTAYRWMQTLVELGLAEKDRFYGHLKNYFLKVDNFEKFLKGSNGPDTCLEPPLEKSVEVDNLFFVSNHETDESYDETGVSHHETDESHYGTTLNIYNKKNKTNTTPIKNIEEVEIKNCFSFLNEEKEKITSKPIKNIEGQAIAEISEIQEKPPNPPLAKKTPDFNNLDLEDRDKLVTREAGIKFMEIVSAHKLRYNPLCDRATVNENVPKYLYIIKWEDGSSYQYVLGGECYWRIDYLSWIWNHENVGKWSEFKELSTQDGYVLLASKHSRWSDRYTKHEYADCLCKRLESFMEWKKQGFVSPKKEEDIKKSEADRAWDMERYNAIQEFKSMDCRIADYRQALVKWLNNSGFEWRTAGGNNYIFDEIMVYSEDGSGPVGIPGCPDPCKQLTPNIPHKFDKFIRQLMNKYICDTFFKQWGFLPE